MSNNPFKRKEKPYRSVSVSEWRFAWYLNRRRIEDSYMTVKSTGGLFGMRISANTEVFGYLLAAAEQGNTGQLHGYITSVAVPAMAMTQDHQLTDDIKKAVMSWMERKAAEGAEEAAKVSETDEAAAQAQMEDIVESVYGEGGQ